MASNVSRGSVWEDEQVRALIAIWGETNIQEELDGATRNKVVFKEIARKLQEQGHNKDWEQCRTKIKNLKREYRSVKDNNGETGRGRKTCKFYTELDSILGHRPASVPAVLLDTGDPQSGTTSSVTEEFSEEVHTNGNYSQLCARKICTL